MTSTSYHQQVAEYYDQESVLFERNYEANPILQRLRTDFRDQTTLYMFSSALEVGCGPGFDLEYFAGRYPDLRLRGVDISPRMVELSRQRLQRFQGQDIDVRVARVDGLSEVFETETFDLIYCYFGALNTVPDLRQAAEHLSRHVHPGSTLVLTFVNKWFLFDIVWNVMRLRWRRAVSRLRRTWPGYAPQRPLPSRCRSAREVIQAFSHHFEVQRRRGYSIVFPAWFRHRFLPTQGRLGRVLWRIDALLNRTPFWNLGEYTLYVFKPR